LRSASKTVAYYLPTDTCKIDRDPAFIVAASRELPEAIKAGILAMVRVAVGRHEA